MNSSELRSAIVDVLLGEGHALNAQLIARRVQDAPTPPTDYFVQRVRDACRQLTAEGAIQVDNSILFHDTGTHWIHTFHAACRYVGNTRCADGATARRAAVNQYAPRQRYATPGQADFLLTQLDLLWSEILDLRAQLNAQTMEDPA